jgi:hypothetical protein
MRLKPFLKLLEHALLNAPMTYGASSCCAQPPVSPELVALIPFIAAHYIISVPDILELQSLIIRFVVSPVDVSRLIISINKPSTAET